MRFTECLRHDVVETASAETVGRVDGFVVRPAPTRVVSLRLGKTASKGMLLDWGQLAAFGPDAVTIGSVKVLHPARDEAERHLSDSSVDLLGKPALTEAGDGLGTVTDVEFDPESGTVLSVLTDRQSLPGDRLIGLGGYAAVFAVTDPSTRSTQVSN